MLEYMQDGAMQTLDCSDYSIQTEWNGADNLLRLSLPRGHPQMLALAERTQLYDSESGQVYRVSKYDRGKSSLEIEAELDLDSLCAGMLLSWDNRADPEGTQWMTLGATVTAILAGTGWTLDDQSARVDVQQMELFSGTPLEAICEAVEIWGNDLGVQYDNAKKIVHLYSPGQRQPTGAYLTEDLNLLEAPQVRGKAARGEYYNRLYLVGADGLTLPEPYYVECRTEGEPIVSHTETNEDISDLEALKTTALSMVQAAAKPARSYTCKAVDLNKLRPKECTYLQLKLYDTILLIDRDDYSRGYQQIVRLRRWPEYPEKDEITLSTVPGTLSATAGRTYSLARKAARRAYDAAKAATDYIADDGQGNVFIGKGDTGIQATPDGLQISGVRQRVLWVNSNISAGAETPGVFAAQTISLDLSSYTAIMVLYTSAEGAHWLDGPEAGEMTCQVLPVNGVQTTLLYGYNTITRRSVKADGTGLVFGGGYRRKQRYTQGVVGSFELADPLSSGWQADDICCVPCYIYGFI